ncbi:MAG: hypothetical protein ACU0DW_11310 [Shimia sp.]
MYHTTKVATCCYCGTRATLVLKGDERHELACSNCGAPLHDLKMLPTGRKAEKGELIDPRLRKRIETANRQPVKKKKKKKRKTLGKKLFEEAFDILEDIFD